MNKGVLFILIIFVGIIIPSHLQASFYSYKKDCINHNLGWNFYCDQQIVEDIDKAQESTELPPKTLAQNAKEKIESLKKREEELRNIAVIYPTQENIKNYLKFNINHLNRSQTFANNAKVAIWQNPSLDINLNGHQPPASGLNKKVWLENLHHNQKQTLKTLNHRYGIFFFYRSDCPYCHKFSPILKRFSQENNLKIIAISLDGKSLPLWHKQTSFNHNQLFIAENFNIQSVPTVILYDKDHDQAIPIGSGVLSHSQLYNRIHKLIKDR